MPRDVFDIDPAAEEARKSRLSYTAAVMRRPRCEVCRQPITTEFYTKLDGKLYCEWCVKKNTHYTDDLEKA